VATVSSDGTVTAVNHGVTTIYATAGGLTKECIVRVSGYAETQSAPPEAGDRSVSGLNWSLDGGVLTISGSGDMEDLGFSDRPWLDYADDIEAVRIREGVTGICDFAFDDCSNVVSVTIPDSVTRIGEYAFSGCLGLEQLVIPDSVTRIGDSAFLYCPNMTEVMIGSGAVEIGDAAFAQCLNLREINVDSRNRAFTSVDGVLYTRDMEKLVACPGGKTGRFTIPGGVAEVKQRAFECCQNLTEIWIPDSVTFIGSMAFYGCTSMIAFTVDPRNQVYASENGCLCTYDLKTLITGPCGRSGIFTIPSGVNVIGKNAFAFSNLTDVTMGKDVVAIDDYAFSDCTRMTSITMPDSISEIGFAAFFGCDSIADVFFSGSKKDWDQININDFGNDSLADATIHYIDSDAIYLSYGDVTIHSSTNETFYLKVLGAGKDADITYTSGNESVASVDENGLVKAMSNGTTHIEVIVNTADLKGINFFCTVWVVD
jgi:hypothetical protein